MEIKDDYRVLVIAANPFSDINNNGKTLKSIFSTFKRDQLYELYFRPQDNIIGDGEFAKSYYAFGVMDIMRSIIRFSPKCGGVQSFEKSKSKEVAEDKVYRGLLKGNLKNIKWLRSLLWRTRKWDTNEYRAWVEQCKPNIVFALLGGPGIMFTIAQEIAKQQNIPLAVYFTDDYLIHWPQNSLIGKIRHSKDEKAFRQIVNKASIGFCIGEKMCEEYEAVFGKKFYPIMNCADIQSYSNKPTDNQHPVISYFGSLWLNRWKMISRLADLVGENGEIYVYTANELNQEMQNAFHKSNIHFKAPVLGEQYKQAVQESDILLHVESDEPDCREKTALSISTKIPDCLVSGKPMMAFGPTEVASIRLLKDYNIGFVVSSEDSVDNNKKIIANFLNNPKVQEEYAERGYLFAENHFDKTKVSQDVKQKLLRVIDEFKK